LLHVAVALSQCFVLKENQEVYIMQKTASSGVARLLSVLFAALAGLFLLIGGIWLSAIGGSFYYVVAGIVMLVTALLLYRRKAIALGLYALFLLCTVVWAVWEAGFDFWALTPRLDVLVVFGIWLLLPFVYRTLDVPGKHMGPALGGILILSGLVLVYAAFNDPQQINGTLSANAAAAVTPASASETAATG
jgi:quinoprotein glucose dehydrogenase